MGFDMNISCAILVCADTGRPFFLTNQGQSVFDLTQIAIVPEEYRKYINLRGTLYYEYTRSFGNDETIVDAAEFLDRFPRWEEIDLNDNADVQWTPADHNKFHDAIQWFANAEVNYIISWSY